MTSRPASAASADDPFGLRSLDVAALWRRPGAKWHRPGGRLATWVADMDFPVVVARSVTVTSASKAFNTAGLRWAVLHASSDRLHRVLADLTEHYFGAPNVMAFAAVEAAWTQGDHWLRAVLEVLDENRCALTGLLAEHLPGAVYRVPDATSLAWIDCRPLGFGQDPAVVFADRGVGVSPGPTFGVEGEGHVRLNLATSPAVLEHIVSAMGG